MSSMEENKDKKDKGGFGQLVTSMILVFSIIIIMVLSTIPSNSNAGAYTGVDTDNKIYSMSDVYRACSNTFVSKYVVKDYSDGYSINNMYKDSTDTYYLDFSDYATDKRYLCKVYMSETPVSKATYNMKNARIKQEVDLVDKLKDAELLKDYTVFELSEYDIKNTENLTRVKTYNASAFSDYTDREMEIKE